MVNKILILVLIVVLVVGATLFITCWLRKEEATTPPLSNFPLFTDFFQARLTLSSQPSLGSNVKLILSIKPFHDVLNTSVTFSLPTQVTLPDSSTRCKAVLGDITKEKGSSFSLPLKVTATGDWAIEAYIAGNLSKDTTLTGSYFLCGRTTDSGGEVLPCHLCHFRPTGIEQHPQPIPEEGEIVIEECPQD